MQTQAVQSEIKAPPSKALEDLLQKTAEHKGCGTQGGSGKASCGSAAGQGDLPTEIWEKVKNHPCYSEEAHHHYARMHVAVAPACNIQCNYCNRKYDCANESRPGVVSEKLTPEQAAKKVVAVASTIPQMIALRLWGYYTRALHTSASRLPLHHDKGPPINPDQHFLLSLTAA